jgi:uncharacterized membrane protein
MIVVAKFLHIFGLMLGAAAAFGNFAVARQVGRMAGAPPPKELLALRPLFARTALVAILLLWVTGLWLYFDAYRDIALGLAFHFKLAAAALLLAAIVVVNVVASRAAKGTPPPSWLPQLHVATRILLVLAVAFAVYVFG